MAIHNYLKCSTLRKCGQNIEQEAKLSLG